MDIKDNREEDDISGQLSSGKSSRNATPPRGSTGTPKLAQKRSVNSAATPSLVNN